MIRMRMWKTAVSLGWAAVALLCVWLVVVSPLQAAPTATFYVDAATGSDGNACAAPGTACATIGAAVAKASSGDTIQIAAGTYNEHDIILNTELTLIGAGAGSTIVDAGGNGRIFTINLSSTLTDMTLQNGQTPADTIIFNSGGGAIRNSTSGVTLLQNMVIRNNIAAGSGGAIFNNGFLTLENTEIISNTAADGNGGGIYHYTLGAITVTQSLIAGNEASSFGGGIYATKQLAIVDSTIRDNWSQTASGGGGGGIHFTGETAVLTNTTISGNRSTTGAGFVANQGVITMTNTTVSGNTASNNYAGVYLYVFSVPPQLTLINSTIANNIRTNSGGIGYNGIMVSGDHVVALQNTIVANNGERQCNPSNNWTSVGYNLSSDFRCSFTSTGDQQGTDPLLGTLADNGGPTLTHALLPGSPAIDAGTNTDCPATDQRGIARPFDGDNDATAICDIGAYEAQNALVIADVAITEGTGGSTTAVFTVTLSPASNQTVMVDYGTSNDTAVSGSDYTSANNTLTFNPGDTSETINVTINPDSVDESDETFFVTLSNPTNADILDGTAVGTILDDDGAGSITIGDVTVVEGTGGAKNAVFDVTLSPAASSEVTVDYATVNGTAVAPNDFTAAIGTLTFNTGESSKQITIPIVTDAIDEGNSEAFTVQLSNPVGASIGDASATATLTDDDTATLRINFGPELLEGDSGTTPATFTVTLSTEAAFNITVDYVVESGFGDDGAKVNVDVSGSLSGTLTFLPGSTLETITVDVVGDTDAEQDELFWTRLSNASVPMSANSAYGRILNDDQYKLYLPTIIR